MLVNMGGACKVISGPRGLTRPTPVVDACRGFGLFAARHAHGGFQYSRRESEPNHSSRVQSRTGDK